MDPGLTGALAVVAGESLLLWDTPTTDVGRRKHTKMVFNREKWRDICNQVAALKPVYVLTETVGGTPKQSNAAGVSFGKAIEGMESGLWYAGVQIEHVVPLAWQRFHRVADARLTKDERKALARSRATELFPQHAHLFVRVSDHNRAEAALIAEYNRQTYSLF